MQAGLGMNNPISSAVKVDMLVDINLYLLTSCACHCLVLRLVLWIPRYWQTSETSLIWFCWGPPAQGYPFPHPPMQVKQKTGPYLTAMVIEAS